MLVVENDGLVRQCTTDLLDEAGFEVIEARDAQEALIMLVQLPHGFAHAATALTDCTMKALSCALRLASSSGPRLVEVNPPLRSEMTVGW